MAINFQEPGKSDVWESSKKLMDRQYSNSIRKTALLGEGGEGIQGDGVRQMVIAARLWNEVASDRGNILCIEEKARREPSLEIGGRSTGRGVSEGLGE